jgi:hypothetical protein
LITFLREAAGCQPGEHNQMPGMRNSIRLPPGSHTYGRNVGRIARTNSQFTMKSVKAS